MVWFHSYTWWNLAYLNQTLRMARRACMVWRGLVTGNKGEGYGNNEVMKEEVIASSNDL